MSRALLLAWRYVSYHKVVSAVLVACLVLTLFLPIAVSLLLGRFNSQIMSRSESTPAVLGPLGSRLDLTLDALYFQTETGTDIPYREYRRAADAGRGTAIPLHLEYTARRFPVVGTNLDYFRFRNISLISGTWLSRLGHCVIGSQVARELQLQAGDKLKTDRENDLDIASNPPLIMHITGVLEPTGTIDDAAVFVDVKTAWVIAGLGHGHDEVDSATDPNLILGQEGNNTIASAAVASYLEITDENRASFHFHGNIEDFPISAVLFVPDNQRASDLLEGDYTNDPAVQFLVPTEVITELMSLVFEVKALFDANTAMIAVATFLLLGLVILLSLKLRQREMETMFKLGCSRGTIVTLQLAEIGIIAAVALCIVGMLIWITLSLADALIQKLLLG